MNTRVLYFDKICEIDGVFKSKADPGDRAA